MSRYCLMNIALLSRECRVNDFIALTRLSNSPCTFQRWSIPTFGAPLESLDRQNSKSVSHSPISEHLKLAETETVSSPPFWDIGPPTHLLGLGSGNLTTKGGDLVDRVLLIPDARTQRHITLEDIATQLQRSKSGALVT